MKTKSFIILSTALLPTVAMADAFNCPFGPGYGFGRGYFMGGGVFMWIITLILFALLGFIIFTLVRNKKGIENIVTHSSPEDAFEILKKRLARGEINEDEYDRLKEKLNG